MRGYDAHTCGLEGSAVVMTMGHGLDQKRAGLVEGVREGYFGVIVSGGKNRGRNTRGAHHSVRVNQDTTKN